MPIDVEKLSTAQIEISIENHRTKKATGAPLYADALRELEKRKGKDWILISLYKSFSKLQ
jgi:hypothetical protein